MKRLITERELDQLVVRVLSPLFPLREEIPECHKEYLEHIRDGETHMTGYEQPFYDSENEERWSYKWTSELFSALAEYILTGSTKELGPLSNMLLQYRANPWMGEFSMRRRLLEFMMENPSLIEVLQEGGVSLQVSEEEEERASAETTHSSEESIMSLVMANTFKKSFQAGVEDADRFFGGRETWTVAVLKESIGYSTWIVLLWPFYILNIYVVSWIVGAISLWLGLFLLIELFPFLLGCSIVAVYITRWIGTLPLEVVRYIKYGSHT